MVVVGVNKLQSPSAFHVKSHTSQELERRLLTYSFFTLATLCRTYVRTTCFIHSCADLMIHFYTNLGESFYLGWIVILLSIKSMKVVVLFSICVQQFLSMTVRGAITSTLTLRPSTLWVSIRVSERDDWHRNFDASSFKLEYQYILASAV